MTKALYFDSDSTTGQAKVLSCTPTEDDLWAVVLDRTLFHPQGGGQPSDTGTIAAVEVKKVIHTPEAIVHLTVAPIIGDVELNVNVKERLIHTRLHSAAHLIGVVGDRMGWNATGGNHFPDESRVIFKPTNPEIVQLIEPSQFEALVTSIVRLGLERSVGETDDGLRTVTWGDLPPYPCGGTHVKNTQDIGKIKITKIKLKKGLITVSYSVE